MVVAVKGGPDQFAVGEGFLIEGALGWYGIDCVFHDTTCSRVRRGPQYRAAVFVEKMTVNFP